MGGNILIYDLNKSHSQALNYSLNIEKYRIDKSQNSSNLLGKIGKKDYDMIIFSLNYLGRDGLKLIEKVREISYDPLIILTKNKDIFNEILALDYGADDILSSPINMEELKVRIKAIIRREKYKNIKIDNHIYISENLTINSLKRTIRIDNKEIFLSVKEFDLFYILSREANRVFTREELLARVWGNDYSGDIRTIDVHIRRIREKISREIKDRQFIMTRWGVGYFFTI